MNKLDLSVLKYYKEGNELCRFESDHPFENLCEEGFLDGDLNLTFKGYDFIRDYPDWDKVETYKNPTKVSIKLNFKNTAP